MGHLIHHFLLMNVKILQLLACSFLEFLMIIPQYLHRFVVFASQ